jgi:sugar lactone lactonase YvrE
MQDLSGVFAKNKRLDSAIVLFKDMVDAPEDVVVGPDEAIYTGLANGDIVRISLQSLSNNSPRAETIEIIANTQGRPLGIKFDQAGNMIIADASKGLIKLDTNGDFTVLASEFDGKKMLLVDYLDIAQNGDIYFSDASTRFGLDDHLLDFVETSMTGRIFKYSPVTQELKLVMDGLFFANGLALGPNDEYLIVAETGKARLLKHHISGDKKGQTEIFIDQLPAMPDNVSFNGKDKFWIGMVTLRDWRIDAMASWPSLRRIVGNVPTSLLAPTSGYGFVLSIDTQGKVIDNLQTEGQYTQITAAIEHGDKLILGSLKEKGVAIYPLID